MDTMHGMKHQLKAAMKTSISNGTLFFVTRIGKCSIKPPFQLILPPYFTETIAERKRKLKEEIILEVEDSGLRWKTSILRSRSCKGLTRIGKGWRQFVEENGVEYGDRLLFTLVRVNRFVVQLFDASGRKKKLRDRKKRTLELCRDKKELSGGGKEEQQQQLDSLLNAAGGQKKQLDEQLDGRKKYLGSLRSHHHTDKGRKELVEHAREDLVDEDEDVAHQKARCVLVRDLASDDRHKYVIGVLESEEELVKKKKKVEEFEQLAGSSRKVSAHEVEYVSRRRDVTDEERGKAMVAARRCVGALCNPSFQLRMRASAVYRKYLLEIPTAFLLDSKLLLQLPPSSDGGTTTTTTTTTTNKVISWFALVDCDNNAWEVICRRGQNPPHHNRLHLSPAGWARFARDHSLEEGDECVFELLLQQQQQEEHDNNKIDNSGSRSSASASVALPTFRVHIFRVVDIQNSTCKAPTGSNPSTKH